LIVLSGCSEKKTEKSEGVITYTVSYPKMDKENFMLDFLPKKLLLKFKDNKYTTLLSAGMGMFQTRFIVDTEKKQFSQLVKLIDKKYLLTLEDEAIRTSLGKLPKFNFEEIKETKKILHFTAKKMIVTVDNASQEKFEIYYTDKIDLKNSNIINQFNPIKGVLLEYQYEKYGICMKLVASKIEFKKINEEEFQLDKTYTNVSEPEMNQKMQEVFDGFK
jgi:hypothetical protein